MKSGTAWVTGKLHERGYLTSLIGQQGGLLVRRIGRPDARIWCVGLDAGETFGPDSVDVAIEAMAEVQLICVLPTEAIEHAAYQRAEERGVCVAGFGELSAALEGDDEVATHVDTQERYERRRLLAHKVVKSLRRLGQHAYEIERRDMPSLTIVTTNRYEFTADEFYTLLEQYEGINPDLIVVTNPNCHGLSSDSHRAAEQAGVPAARFQDFLDSLDEMWT